MDKVLVIVGPTASGKSGMAVKAAKKFGGEVISADSMQVYRGMDIGTAKITEEEMDGVPHHLIDIREIDEAWSVAAFQKECREAIADIRSRGKLPIVCGGTGLYVKGALYDYSFEEEQDPVLDQKQKELEALSNEQLHALLEERDPEALEKIHPNNRQRLLRAALMSYGPKRKSDREKDQQHTPVYDVLMIGLRAERPEEIARIEARVDEMFEQGLANEVQRLFSDPKTRKYNSFQGIGYKEFAGWLDGKETLDTVRKQIKIKTRQYARRQMTWFGNQMPVCWFRPQQKEQVLETIEKWLDNNGKYAQES